MTVHAAAAPTRRGVHPHRATSPPQLEGERDGEAIARTRRTAQIRSRHAPEVCSGLFSTGPSPPCSSENATGYGSWPHFMSGRAKGSWTVLDGDNIPRRENETRRLHDGRSMRRANRQIASRRLLTRERGGGGERQPPSDCESQEGAAGPPPRRRRPVSLRTSAPRGFVLAGDTGNGRDDSSRTHVVLSVPHQGAREQPHVGAVRRSHGWRRERVRLWRDAIRMVCVHRLGPNPVFGKRLVRY